MKTVQFYAGRNRSNNLLHIETDGCIVNIHVGLTDNQGRKVTTVMISPEDESRGGDGEGRIWHLVDGCRLVQQRAADDFDDLPNLAQDFTYEQVERIVKHLAKQSLAKLRQRQSIHTQQITLAHDQDKPDVVRSEQVWMDITTAAVGLREFGQMQWSALLPQPPSGT